MASSKQVSSLLNRKKSWPGPVSVVLPIADIPKTKLKKLGTGSGRGILVEGDNENIITRNSPRSPATESPDWNSSKIFMSPENRPSTNKSAMKKIHTPRTVCRMQKQHRDNERNRHQGMNAIIQDLSEMVPGYGACGKETKIHTMKKLICYICHLEEYILELIETMGLDVDFHDLLLLPYMTEKDIEAGQYIPPTLKPQTVKPPSRKRPAEGQISCDPEKSRKLSSPTVDSTTIDVPRVNQLGQAYIQLKNGNMTPIGTVQQSKDGSNYITIPEIVTTSEMYRGGTILIPSVVGMQEFHACSSQDQEDMSEWTQSSSDSGKTETSQEKSKYASSALGSPILISPFSSPQGPRTPFLHPGEATPLLSQTSITAFNSPVVLNSPRVSFLSQGSDSVTPSKMVESSTLVSPSGLSLPLPDQEEPETPGSTAPFTPTNYLSAFSLIRNSRQDVATYAAEFSDHHDIDDDGLDEPVFFASYKKPKPKNKQVKKKRVCSYRKPASLDPPFMFYGVGKYVDEKRRSGHGAVRTSNNSLASTIFSKEKASAVSSTQFKWKFEDNTAELLHKDTSEDPMPSCSKPSKLDHRRTSWMNGFMMFSRIHRRDFIDVNPGIPTSQISKLLGQTWKGMSTEEQEPYKIKAKRYVNYLVKAYDMVPNSTGTIEDTSAAEAELQDGKADSEADGVPPAAEGVLSIKEEDTFLESNETNSASEGELESSQEKDFDALLSYKSQGSESGNKIAGNVNKRVVIKMEHADENVRHYDEGHKPDDYSSNRNAQVGSHKSVYETHGATTKVEKTDGSIGQCRRHSTTGIEPISYGLDINEE